MTAQERYKILLNIVSKVGIDGDLIGEFGKTMAALNGFQTYNEMNPPMPPQPVPQTGQEAPVEDMSATPPMTPTETTPMV